MCRSESRAVDSGRVVGRNEWPEAHPPEREVGDFRWVSAPSRPQGSRYPLSCLLREAPACSIVQRTVHMGRCAYPHPQLCRTSKAISAPRSEGHALRLPLLCPRKS